MEGKDAGEDGYEDRENYGLKRGGGAAELTVPSTQPPTPQELVDKVQEFFYGSDELANYFENFVKVGDTILHILSVQLYILHKLLEYVKRLRDRLILTSDYQSYPASRLTTVCRRTLTSWIFPARSTSWSIRMFITISVSCLNISSRTTSRDNLEPQSKTST